MGKSLFTQRVVEIIRSIPKGRVSTYGMVAQLAGNARAARQVTRILHSLSEKENLPWHRVVNREGQISLGKGRGYEEQKKLLLDEGVKFNLYDKVDLEVYGLSKHD
jgi:methylated-DNA-protein-cysteine methyltransferase-like protein